VTPEVRRVRDEELTAVVRALSMAFLEPSGALLTTERLFGLVDEPWCSTFF
jgi:hypothetical protein